MHETFNAQKLQRELDALARLEEQIRRTVDPSTVLLQQIAARREELLHPERKQT